jgi:heptosyltransferase-2
MKILVVQTGFLGDVVLSTAVLENLKIIYPRAKIIFLTTVLAKGLVEAHPSIDEVLTFDKRKSQSGLRGLLEMVQLLRDRKIDLVFSLHKSYRTALLLWLSRIPIRYGFKEAKGQLFYSKTSPRKDLSHEVQRNLAILRNIGVVPTNLVQKLSLNVPADVERKVHQRYLSRLKRPIIGIAPGSVWATKRWTAEGFSEVAKQLLALGYSVILIGGKEDAEIALKINNSIEGKALNLVGQTSLPDSMAVIKNLNLLLTNDSAPLHIASAFKVPTVALFCATVPEFGFGPWQTRSKVLGVENLKCRPCGRHGAKTCPTGTFACQLELKSDKVVSAILELLEEQTAIERPLQICIN